MKLLCKIFHRWTNIDGSKNGHSNQKCRRCGVLRDYYGTGGWGCYGEPYAPKFAHDLKRAVEITNEMVEEIWKLRNENAKLKAADCRITPQDITDTMPPRVGWDL